jgi:ribosome recycling factor
MPDPKETKLVPATNGASVHAKNTINVVMEDLTKEDNKEIERELEEEVAEMRRKLTCFQKTSNNIIKKTNMAAASGTKVNSQLSPEDLVHMVDMSVASMGRT